MTKPTVEETRRIICRNEVAATIERCAQVVDRIERNARLGKVMYSDIAAAIRALKDKPHD